MHRELGYLDDVVGDAAGHDDLVRGPRTDEWNGVLLPYHSEHGSHGEWNSCHHVIGDAACAIVEPDGIDCNDGRDHAWFWGGVPVVGGTERKWRRNSHRLRRRLLHGSMYDLDRRLTGIAKRKWHLVNDRNHVERFELGERYGRYV